LADFAADQRAPTPTGAAEMATPDSAGERQALMQADRWLTDAYLQAVQSLRASWLALQNRLDRLNPRAGIRNEQQRVDGLAERLRLAASHGMELRHSRLVGLASRLEALNPLAILERGYAVVTTEAGQVVRRPVDVQAGQPLVVQVADGKFGVQVTDPSPADLQGKE
ncbi:MAG: hypothetical protein KA058_00195, partial [Anaerolineaceae bacterium]|nr:hypothetical protein [Anaerolineaceae bacterium]